MPAIRGMGSRRWCGCVLLSVFLTLFAHPLPAQQASEAAAIRKIDTSVATRDEDVLGYTVTEQYRVYRNGNTAHPAAEMTVKTTYRKDAGKSYVILAQSGSDLLLREVLDRVLDSERLMTQPANRAQALLTSANYSMTVKANEMLDGQRCLRLAITPKRSSPFLFKGDIWVEAEDGSIVKLDGTASRSASVLTGAAQVSRRYQQIDGYPMATHASAVSESWLLGRTTIEIDYTDYQMTLRNSSATAQPAGPAVSAGSHQ